MFEDRKKRIHQVSHQRQLDLAVVLENVHDPHNIGAVLRTCDSIGVQDVYVLYTEDHLGESNLYLGQSASSGARKWLNVYLMRDLDKCVAHLKKNYQRILGTHLSTTAQSIYDVDFTQPTALVFGNERDGISEELLKHLDGNIVIPQVGMVRSLNISVACAVTMYEVLRQREKAGLYKTEGDHIHSEHQDLQENFIGRHEQGYRGTYMIPADDL